MRYKEGENEELEGDSGSDAYGWTPRVDSRVNKKGATETTAA